MPFALIIHGKEVLNPDNTVAVKEGTPFWVIETNVLGLCVTTEEMKRSHVDVPENVKIFDSAVKADLFARRWKGHPWWVQPRGTCEIVEIEPVMVTVQKGWRNVYSK